MSILCAVTHKNEDAARKWCPFSSPGKGDRHEVNTANLAGSVPAVGGRCLTTGCMAWIDDSDHNHDIAMGRCGLVALTNT